MMVDIPSPAGVSAPVRLMPTVHPGSSIFREKRRHASRSRPALYARKALSTRSATARPPWTGGGLIACPRRYPALPEAMAGPRLVVLLGDSTQRLARPRHARHRFRRIVGDGEDVEVLRADVPPRHRGVAQPGDQTLPVRRADQHHREV